MCAFLRWDWPMRSTWSAAVFACCLAVWPGVSLAEGSRETPQVLMMGSFHFANPGLDAVKSPVIDVTGAESQAWLETLAARIAAFAPTDVLVECPASEQADLEASLAGYRAGTYALSVNEIDQVGVRVAAAAGAERITCFDQRDVHWAGGALMGFMEANDPEMLEQFKAQIRRLSEREADEHARLPLAELLRRANTPERDRENRGLYLFTNPVDAGGSYAGADAAASWWRRNFHMYANVQKAAQPGRRVFVLAGAGHTAVMRELLASDPGRQAVDITPYLAD